jgi:hypothetical protein
MAGDAATAGVGCTVEEIAVWLQPDEGRCTDKRSFIPPFTQLHFLIYLSFIRFSLFNDTFSYAVYK